VTSASVHEIQVFEAFLDADRAGDWTGQGDSQGRVEESGLQF